MTNVTHPRDSRRGSKDGGGNALSRLVGALGLYIGQILDELRKVVRPTRSELWNYTLVVIVFVTTIMIIIAALDWVFTRVVQFVFGGA